MGRRGSEDRAAAYKGGTFRETAHRQHLDGELELTADRENQYATSIPLRALKRVATDNAVAYVVEGVSSVVEILLSKCVEAGDRRTGRRAGTVRRWLRRRPRQRRRQSRQSHRPSRHRSSATVSGGSSSSPCSSSSGQTFFKNIFEAYRTLARDGSWVSLPLQVLRPRPLCRINLQFTAQGFRVSLGRKACTSRPGPAPLGSWVSLPLEVLRPRQLCRINLQFTSQGFRLAAKPARHAPVLLPLAHR